jgi:NTP pyrophosphatase (non-canonical NTP hydrolase)
VSHIKTLTPNKSYQFQRTDVEEEIGDLFFMGFILAKLCVVDPIEVMLEKAREKGLEE